MKVGDYIRTKDGIIAKIIGVRENPYGEKTIFELDREINIFDLEMGDIYLLCNPIAEETTNKIDTHFGDDKIITKSSPNIIDLIEVGDYVNGEKVTNINGILYVKNIGALEEINIKSIVTKEQFEAMEYKCEWFYNIWQRKRKRLESVNHYY